MKLRSETRRVVLAVGQDDEHTLHAYGTLFIFPPVCSRVEEVSEW